jgi:hypothetical protein
MSRRLAERQFQTCDGATVIVGHPANSPEATGSVVARVKEVGFDDTSVGLRIRKSLLQPSADRAALASKTFRSTAVIKAK